jgi:hypothetical protein
MCICLGPIYQGDFMTRGLECQVYFLRDPSTAEVFYVGIGKPGRAFAHTAYVKTAIRKTGTPTFRSKRHQRILEIITDGNLPVVEIVHDGISKTEAQDLEISYIARFGRMDLGTGKLTNATRGGEWINDCPRTDEWRQRMSEAGKIAQNQPETKALKSAALKNKKRTPAQIENIRQAQLAIRDVVAEKRTGGGNPAAKKCCVNDIEYPSLTDAAIALGFGDRPWMLKRRYQVSIT